MSRVYQFNIGEKDSGRMPNFFLEIRYNERGGRKIMDSKYHTPCFDALSLMRQIAKLANVPDVPIIRMVLVLDTRDNLPRLYYETYLSGEQVKENVELKCDVPIEVSEGKVEVGITLNQTPRCNLMHSEYGACSKPKGHRGFHSYTEK